MEAWVQRWRAPLWGAAWALYAGFCAGAAHGASLTAGTPRSNDDATLAIPIVLTPFSGEQVAALQFDAGFDPRGLALAGESGASLGAAAQAADKSVHAARIRPGQLRVIIAGLNQNVIKHGEVAVLHFQRRESSGDPAGLVSLTNVVLSDPTGLEVPARASGGDSAGFTAGSPGAGAAAAPGGTDDGPRSGVVLVAAVLAAAGAGWWYLGSRRTGNRRRSRP